MTTATKKQIIRDMTVLEVSSVDRPAIAGATAVILKSADTSLPIRKNAAEVASGSAEPLYKAAEYGEAMIARSVELAKQYGGTPEAALMNHSGTDPVLIELACAERSAEIAVRKARTDSKFSFATDRAAKLPPARPEQRDCMLCNKSFESKHPRASHQMCDACTGG
jgi:hypothetical protein